MNSAARTVDNFTVMFIMFALENEWHWDGLLAGVAFFYFNNIVSMRCGKSYLNITNEWLVVTTIS